MAGKHKLSVGDKYGALELIEDTGKRDSNGNIYWKCKCDCGNIVIRHSGTLMASVVKHCKISCGCMRDKSIGKRLANDKNRIDKAREGLGQIDGTTMQGIDRKSLNKNNKSGVRGVHWSSREQKWRACLELRGVQYRALFDKFEDAVKYRKWLEDTYFEPIKEKYKEVNKDA